MSKRHCYARSCKDGICPTCGEVFEGESKGCPMEIYDPVEQWVSPHDIPVTDKILMVVIAVAGLFGLAKAFGVW